MLQRVIERAQQIEGIDKLVVATTALDADLPIAELCADLAVTVVRGSEKDVLARYWMAAKILKLDGIVRITADCPLLDPKVSSIVVGRYLTGKWDYVTNR